VKTSTLSKVLIGLIAAIWLCGCAMMGAGPSDEELVLEAVNDMMATMSAQNVEKLLTWYSEDFEHYEWGDKEGLAEFLEDAVAMGYLDDAESSLEETEVKIEEGVATVYPVELTAAFGSSTIELTLKKENGKWMVTGMEVEEY